MTIKVRSESYRTMIASFHLQTKFFGRSYAVNLNHNSYSRFILASELFDGTTRVEAYFLPTKDAGKFLRQLAPPHHYHVTDWTVLEKNQPIYQSKGWQPASLTAGKIDLYLKKSVETLDDIGVIKKESD